MNLGSTSLQNYSNKRALELVQRAKAKTASGRVKTLLDFTEHTFPGYEANWHHKKLCGVLDRFVAGELPRLIVLMPPRHGKSELVSRRLPAYIFGKNPNARIIAASYGDTLAQSMNRDVQRIIDSAEYRALFPDTKLAGPGISGKYTRTNSMFEIVGHKGSYIGSGVGGGIVGEGFNYGIIDDPIKNRLEANSPAKRKAVLDWYKSTFYTRQEKNASILITMTPWHPDDLIANLLKMAEENHDADQWVVIRFPAISDLDADLNDLDTRKKGTNEPLWEQKYNAKALKSFRANSEFEWQAQYMCRPRVPEGSAVKREWFEIIEAIPSGYIEWVRYWDKAGTPGGGAYTAGVLMGRYPDGFIIADVVRGQWGATERETMIRQTAVLDRQKYGRVKNVLEQEGGSGGKDSAETTIRNLAGFEVEKDTPTGDKNTRFYPFAAQAGVRDVKLFKGLWNEDWLIEVCSFPDSTYKDQVDSTSGAFKILTLGDQFETYETRIERLL
jgi:predicted phage terminase large subunit-like protein